MFCIHVHICARPQTVSKSQVPVVVFFFYIFYILCILIVFK